MIKGIAYVNRGFRYQIHATDRKDSTHGVIVVDAQVDEFDAKVTIYDSGTVIIKSPDRIIEFNLDSGLLKCE